MKLQNNPKIIIWSYHPIINSDDKLIIPIMLNYTISHIDMHACINKYWVVQIKNKE